jgi:hypothetical protein
VVVVVVEPPVATTAVALGRSFNAGFARPAPSAAALSSGLGRLLRLLEFSAEEGPTQPPAAAPAAAPALLLPLACSADV